MLLYVLRESKSVRGRVYNTKELVRLDNTYKNRNNPEAIIVYIIIGNKIGKSKLKTISELTKTLKLRIAAEEKLPKPKTQRSVILEP